MTYRKLFFLLFLFSSASAHRHMLDSQQTSTHEVMRLAHSALLEKSERQQESIWIKKHYLLLSAIVIAGVFIVIMIQHHSPSTSKKEGSCSARLAREFPEVLINEELFREVQNQLGEFDFE